MSHGWNSRPDAGWRARICAAGDVQQPAGGSRADVQPDPQQYLRASDARVPLFPSFKSHMLSLSRDRRPPSNALLTTPRAHAHAHALNHAVALCAAINSWGIIYTLPPHNLLCIALLAADALRVKSTLGNNCGGFKAICSYS